MSNSSIVRFGPTENNLSAQLLRKAITSFFQPNAVGGEDDDSQFAIQNKYFTANIRFEDIDATQDENDSTSDDKEDGVILVFDALQSNPDKISDDVAGSGATFDSLHATHQKVTANNTCGDLLRLCVGVSLSEISSPDEIRGKEHEKEYARRIHWCLDNGYEYIEADISEAGQEKGHNDRDKDGFARIIEAIQGTMWSSASMTDAKSNALKDEISDAKAALQDMEASSTTTAEPANEKEEEIKYEPPDSSLFVTASSDCKTSNDGVADDIAAIFGLKERSSGTGGEDMDAERLFAQMESVLKEASQIRQASKSGVLSDEERRERAGEAALALVNLMGQFGLDDDDDSEGYGSDDSLVV